MIRTSSRKLETEGLQLIEELAREEAESRWKSDYQLLQLEELKREEERLGERVL